MSVPDYPLGVTVDFKFTSRAFATGIPTTLAGNPVVEIYEDNGTTDLNAETLTVDAGGNNGLNNLRVVMTSGNGFEAGKSYQAVIVLGTVGGVSVVGEVVQQFSIERSPALRPTTAGRTARTDASGYILLSAGAGTGQIGLTSGAVETDPTSRTASKADVSALATSVQTDRNADLIESQRGHHSYYGNYYYVDPVNGDTHANGKRGGRADPYLTIQDCHDNAVTDSNHDVIFLVAGAAAGVTTHTVAATTTISKRYTLLRGSGRDFIITRTGAGDTIAITGDGVEISGVQIGTAATGSGDGVDITDADFVAIHDCWFLDTQGDGIHILRGSNCQLRDNHFEGTGVGGSGQGIHISGTAGSSNDNVIYDSHFADTGGDAIKLENGTTEDTTIRNNEIHDATGWGINIGGSSTNALVHDNFMGNNSSGNITDAGATSVIKNNYDVAVGVADEVLTGATHNVSNSLGRRIRELDEQIGYQDGAVWIDTANGASGAVVGENGTVNNPVDNITQALALAVAIGITRLRVASGSSITLVAEMEGYEVYNCNWTLVLNGQSISDSCIIGADVTGIATGAVRPKFSRCQLGAVTLPPAIITKCGIGDNSGAFTVGSAGQYVFDECYSLVPGSGTPTFTMTGTGSATGINNRGWKGGASYTLDSDITLSHEVVVGGGTTIVTGGADVEVRGITRSLTLTLSNAGTVQFVGITGPIAISGTATSTVNLYGVSSSLTDTSSGTTVTDATTGSALAAIQADLPNTITKNTALANFPFLMVLSSDHVTGATEKTVTATRSLDGGAFAPCANNVFEVASGAYKINLAATDTNGDTIMYLFTAADCDARVISVVTKPT